MAERAKVQAGTASVNASDLKQLQYAWKNRQLVLFLGAGVSIPYGLPSWKNLVLELLFEQAQSTRRLGALWPQYRRAVASWMTDYFQYDPLVLARMVERDLRAETSPGGETGDGTELFLERLRTHLYSGLRTPTGRTLLTAIGDLISKSDDTRGINSVVTFNFDNLLEEELTSRKVKLEVVTSRDRQHGTGLKVIHPHGYIPKEGPLYRENIVFTEPDYHKLTESVFHWGLAEIVERLRKNTVLFIGLSMSDPSLRRLLDAAKNSDIPAHWQIQKRHEIHDSEKAQVMIDVEQRARKYASDLGDAFQQTKDHDQMNDAIRAALRQADTYDREVFESMGVKTIWVDKFDDVPGILDAIAT